MEGLHCSRIRCEAQHTNLVELNILYRNCGIALALAFAHNFGLGLALAFAFAYHEESVVVYGEKVQKIKVIFSTGNLVINL